MKRTVIDARGDKFSLENFGHREYELDMTPAQEAQYKSLNENAAREAQALKAIEDKQKAREAFIDQLMNERGVS